MITNSVLSIMVASVVAVVTLGVVVIVFTNLIAANKEVTVTRGRGRTGGVG